MNNTNINRHYNTLEFNTIREELAQFAVSNAAKEACLNLIPAQTIDEVKRLLDETTGAKLIMEETGTPPLAIMQDLPKIIDLLNADAMLSSEQINYIATFIKACIRMKDYLRRAEQTGADISYYGRSIADLEHVEEELSRCLKNGQIEDRASDALYEVRRSIERKEEQIRAKLENLLQRHSKYCAESFFAMRNGRYTLPVKKEHRTKIEGTIVEMSNTGSTCFIEPSSIRKLQDEMSSLKIEEENEVIIILYTLTALIYDNLSSIKLNMEALEKLDFLFAKAKLSFAMKATQIRLTDTKQIRLIGARHPLIAEDLAVPLNFALGDGIRGIIITGPNTGGKTVAIKTVGLLSLMTQSGLHIPADNSSSMCIFDRVLCDIGDGQSITENLSTFSAHMTNIIDILSQTTTDSLILLDELGSGTDPAEGMGIAMAVLEELVSKNCLFTATTHYPEIKDFAENTPSLINARMAFDKETLLPLYRLEIGEAGESCALHIAQRLGMSDHILSRAREITYSGVGQKATRNNADVAENKSESKIQEVKALEVEEEAPKIQVPLRSEGFNIGDTVTVYPQKQIGIVYARTNKKGEIGVQIQGEKKLIAHKRIKLKTPAAELYPDDYDFSIIFDSVADRKARHQMNRKLVKGVTVPTQKWG